MNIASNVTRQYLTSQLRRSRCCGGGRRAQWRHLLATNGDASCLTVLDGVEPVSVTPAAAISELEALV